MKKETKDSHKTKIDRLTTNKKNIAKIISSKAKIWKKQQHLEAITTVDFLEKVFPILNFQLCLF